VVNPPRKPTIRSGGSQDGVCSLGSETRRPIRKLPTILQVRTPIGSFSIGEAFSSKPPTANRDIAPRPPPRNTNK